VSQSTSSDHDSEQAVAPSLDDEVISKLDCDDETRADIRKLREIIREYGDAVVAMSGGVDSGVVAAISKATLADRAVAVTGVGQAVSQSELGDCQGIVKQIGIRHVVLTTREIENPNYVRNTPNRCYFCKDTLYKTIGDWAISNGFRTLVSGTNQDDLGDYRPGLKAAAEHQVRAPLAEAGLGKTRVRSIARALQLTVADKPASPCLASRIAYGQLVTPENLRRVESMESLLHSLGFHDVRARVHGEQLLRLELHQVDWNKILDPVTRETINAAAKQHGFLFVTMDLTGRQSGSLNRVLPILSQ
jgi:pyridinium-3,5-biscarboxylic acid mononucleotide sulfurtransferase